MANNFKLDYTGEEVNSILTKANDLEQVTVATSITSSGTNPVTSQAIYNALSKKADTSAIPSIDSSLSTSSTRAVQNKVITNKLNTIESLVEMNSKTYTPAFEAVYGGVSWGDSTSGTQELLNNVIFANDLFVATGNAGVIITSPDAATWTIQTSNVTTNLFGIAYGLGRWIVVGSEGTILSSLDNGITWNSINHSYTDISFKGAFFDGEKFYLMGSSGTFLSTIDFESYNSYNLGATDTVVRMCKGDNCYGLITSSCLYKSIDGINWTRKISGYSVACDYGSPAGGYFTSIAYGKGCWIISGYTSTNGGGAHVYRSYDNLETFESLYNTCGSYTSHRKDYGATYGGNQFLVVGDGTTAGNYAIGHIRVTQDNGSAWKTYVPSGYRLYDICYGKNLYVAVGANGTIKVADASFSMTGLKLTVPATSFDIGFTIKIFGIGYTNDEGIFINDLVNTTLNVNEMGAKPIQGIISNGIAYTLVYNGSSWIIQNENLFLKQEIIFGETIFNHQKEYTCFMIGILRNNSDLKIILPNSEYTLYTQEEGKDIKVITTDTTISIINHTDNTENIIYKIVE